MQTCKIFEHELHLSTGFEGHRNRCVHYAINTINPSSGSVHSPVSLPLHHAPRESDRDACIRTRATVGRAAYQLKPAPTPPEVWPLADDTPIETLALLLENTCWKPIDAALRLP